MQESAGGESDSAMPAELVPSGPPPTRPTALLATGPSAPVRRQGLVRSDDEITRVAEQLFVRFDPTTPSRMIASALPTIQHCYTKGVLASIDERLGSTVVDHGRLYLQGSQLGVGTTTLVSDYGRAYNYMAGSTGHPQRVAVVRVFAGMTVPAKMLELLCNYMRSPLSIPELRFRSLETLAERFVFAARQLRVTTIIFDHIHHASGAALRLIGDLMLASDPRLQVPFERDEFSPPPPRLGIVLVSHIAPENLFSDAEEVLHLLEGSHVLMGRYETAEDIGEILRRAGIGLDDLDLSCMDDALMAQIVLEWTSGLLSLINPLLRVLLSTTQLEGQLRPSLETLHTALPYHRHLREKILRRRDPSVQGDEFKALLTRAAAVASGHRTPVAIASGCAEGAQRVCTGAAEPTGATSSAAPSRRKEIAAKRKATEEGRRKVVRPVQRRRRH